MYERLSQLIISTNTTISPSLTCNTNRHFQKQNMTGLSNTWPMLSIVSSKRSCIPWTSWGKAARYLIQEWQCHIRAGTTSLLTVYLKHLSFYSSCFFRGCPTRHNWHSSNKTHSWYSAITRRVTSENSQRSACFGIWLHVLLLPVKFIYCKRALRWSLKYIRSHSIKLYFHDCGHTRAPFTHCITFFDIVNWSKRRASKGSS
jgi:hypothetical protein